RRRRRGRARRQGGRGGGGAGDADLRCSERRPHRHAARAERRGRGLDHAGWATDEGGRSEMIMISAFSWVPDFAQGQVRDLRARWALEETGLPYRTRLLALGDQDKPDYRAL